MDEAPPGFVTKRGLQLTSQRGLQVLHLPVCPYQVQSGDRLSDSCELYKIAAVDGLVSAEATSWLARDGMMQPSCVGSD